MARGRTPKNAGPTKVEAIVHTDKRTNLPTADAHDLVGPEVDAPVTLRYPRDPSLDPQLVWKGKDEQDSADLEVDGPPLYIQEKIDPRVLVENLRRTAKNGEPEPEMALFDSFDGLDELDLVDFYRHEANWSNRMILGDSLQVMASLAERERLRGKVQMVYIDPPYGIKFGSNWQTTARSTRVRDGNLSDSSREVELIRAFRDTWELGIHSYLSYLRDRLYAARDLLTSSGSVFVQIGDDNVHLVRSVMDEVFGSQNFVNAIVFQKTSGAGSPSGTTEVLARVSDHLLWYARNRDTVKYRELFLPKGLDSFIPSAYGRVEDEQGTRRSASRAEKAGELEPGRKLYALDNLVSPSGVDKTRYPVVLDGETWLPGAGVWKTGRDGMARLVAANRVEATKSRLGYVRYLEDFPAIRLTNVWTDAVSSFMADKIYVVQTNTKIVDRCLLMTTDPGDLVIDPTCGSGTTAFVAEQRARRWITIDSSRVALALARQRLMGARFPFYLLADSHEGREREREITGVSSGSGELRGDVRHGFVYTRIPHVTLKSIANNPDIREGMTAGEIEAAISRHAESEFLYDTPYEDRRKVRVTGPFTVESLSPHRSLAFAPTEEPASEQKAAQAPGGASFEQSILSNLSVAGIQNGRRNERLELVDLAPYAGRYLQAVGMSPPEADAAPKRVGVAIGPQYGTVSPAFIKNAAREAIRAEVIDLVCILGFAFDPQALGIIDEANASDEGFANVAAERKLGRVPVLLVRMNADLVMGEELKKTGAGNLFTVFGEPDIDITRTKSGEVVVTIRGVDVYDPTTGAVRSRDTNHIALWMIDTDYDEESFFVRHCYFTGGNDPYRRLKQALKADIDEDAWASLNSTTSRPFPPPETGKIAVKVINDYGDEVMKVFEV
jgi:adenine-specific DNA-methyltransferase